MSGRRATLLAAVLLLATACGDGRAAEGGQAGSTPPPTPAEVSPEAAPQATPAAAAAPLSREDSIQLARDDSTQLARDYHQRLGSMESYESCIRKAKDADPQQRAVLETACKRSRAPSP